jgi:hypothetical protein
MNEERDEDFEWYRRAAGKIMGEIFVEIFNHSMMSMLFWYPTNFAQTNRDRNRIMDKNKNQSRTGSSNHGSEDLKPRRHPLFGRLKGTFTVDPEWDLTKPAMPEWADTIDEKYGPELPKRNR